MNNTVAQIENTSYLIKRTLIKNSKFYTNIKYRITDFVIVDASKFYQELLENYARYYEIPIGYLMINPSCFFFSFLTFELL